jgi:hypothetical protein
VSHRTMTASGIPRTLASVLAIVFLSSALAVAKGQGTPRAAGGAGPEAEIAHVTAPVLLDGESLFRVRGTSTYPAEERARRIAGRIEEVARSASISPQTVQAVAAEDLVNVTAGDRFLVAVTEPDARLEGLDRQLLAKVYVDRIQGALRAYRQAREPEVLLRGARRALAATAFLLATQLCLLWGFRKLESRFGRRYEEKIRSIQIQSFEILRAKRIRSVLRAILGVARAVTAAVLVYFWLNFVLSSFPLTRPLAARLLTLVLDPLSRLGSGLLAQLPDLAFLLVLLLITRWLLGLVRLFFEAAAKGHVTLSGFDPEWALPTYRIVRIAVVAFALVVAYPYIPGSRSAAFQSISIFLGVVFSIGSSSLDPPQQQRGELQRARAQPWPHPAHHGRHRLRDALAAGRGDAPPGGRAYAGPRPRARAVRAPEVARRLLRRLRGQRLLRRSGRDDSAVRAAPPEHPRRLQRVRGADHDPSLRGRPRAAQGRAEGTVVERPRATVRTCRVGSHWGGRLN